MMKRKKRYTIGVDEVGRGPIAGPVAVGAFAYLDNSSRKLFRGVKESKQLNEAERERWFSIINECKKRGTVDYNVSFQSEKVIDDKGLTFVIRKALEISIRGLCISPDDSEVLLDGGLKAPAEYKNQQTIIKGDEKKQVIALASICAKVMRDRRMNKLACKHAEYGFEKHKGYGTKSHYEAIRIHGLLPTHRRSFLKGRW